jgi:hypothetical protein
MLFSPSLHMSTVMLAGTDCRYHSSRGWQEFFQEPVSKISSQITLQKHAAGHLVVTFLGRLGFTTSDTNRSSCKRPITQEAREGFLISGDFISGTFEIKGNPPQGDVRRNFNRATSKS